MTEVKDDLKREKVRIVEISKIKDFPDHPFLVKDDESMEQLVNIGGIEKDDFHGRLFSMYEIIFIEKRRKTN